VSNRLSVKPGRLEAWVVGKSTWLALGVIAVAFAERFVYADSCYLNPDEASHFDQARPSSWLDSYRAALTQAHPPLFILVLHGVLFLGRSEVVLRLPSLVGGTVALWLAFAWLRRNLGAVPALAGLGFMAFSPAAVSASTEVRQYGLLLCFVCGSLYATERAFSERSIRWAIIQGLFQLCALLTHYTAIVAILSLNLYVLLRFFADGLPRRILVTMGVSQIVLAVVLACLYFGHVRGYIPFGPGASMDYLRNYYYAAARETPLGFVWRALSGTFSYAAGERRLALLLMAAFLAGLAALLAGRVQSGKSLMLLLLAPFAVGFVAAAFQVFPFAGSRHQTYLLPFLAAGIAAALTCLHRRWAVLLLLSGAVLAPFWVTRTAPENNRQNQPIGDMAAAITYVDQTVPYESPLFVDYETREVLRYYLTRNDTSMDILRSNVVVEEQQGRYRVVVPQKYVWAFRPNEALEQVNESARALDVPSGDSLWVFSAAWYSAPLASRLPADEAREGKEFGLISVIKIKRQ